MGHEVLLFPHPPHPSICLPPQSPSSLACINIIALSMRYNLELTHSTVHTS